MKHILIVDDDKMNLFSAKNAIAKSYEITDVTSGKEALEFLHKQIPDLILLDINMPDMDGFEVLEEIVKIPEASEVPVIFLTAENDAKIESKCLMMGARDFIVKPFVPVVMRSRIGRILELEDYRKHLANRLDEKIKEVSDIKAKSLTDALTGLWNRNYTEEKVSEILREEKKGTLFMMDMDNFKAINDNYGHMAGDHVLKMFAETLKKHSSEEDIACRIGGDEFMLFIRGEVPKEELAKKATGIIYDMCSKIEECKFDTNSSVSAGISQFPGDGDDFQSLYNAADKALYCVKQNGKNSYHFYSDQSASESRRAGKNVDLNYLREIMKRADINEGSYMLDFDNFHHVYNFIRRTVERNEAEVQTVLFTLYSENAHSDDPSENENAIEMLEKAVFSCLRKVDVSARYSSRQLIVILMDANKENGKMVVERILNSYKEIYDGPLAFEYDIITM